MAYQVSINTCPVMIRIPMADAAKLHTFARLQGEKKGVAPSMSNEVGALLHVYLHDIVADADAVAWTENRRRKAREIRAKSDARTKEGVWRKEGWQEVLARRQERLAKKSGRASVKVGEAA